MTTFSGFVTGTMDQNLDHLQKSIDRLWYLATYPLSDQLLTAIVYTFSLCFWAVLVLRLSTDLRFA